GLGERLLQLHPHGLRLIADLDLDDVAAVGVALLDLGLVARDAVLLEHVPGHAALEVDAQLQPALPQRQPADGEERQRDDHPQPAATPEVDRRLAEDQPAPAGLADRADVGPRRTGVGLDGAHAGGAPRPNWSWRSRRPVPAIRI